MIATCYCRVLKTIKNNIEEGQKADLGDILKDIDCCVEISEGSKSLSTYKILHLLGQRINMIILLVNWTLVSSFSGISVALSI